MSSFEDHRLEQAEFAVVHNSTSIGAGPGVALFRNSQTRFCHGGLPLSESHGSCSATFYACFCSCSWSTGEMLDCCLPALRLHKEHTRKQEYINTLFVIQVNFGHAWVGHYPVTIMELMVYVCNNLCKWANYLCMYRIILDVPQLS